MSKKGFNCRECINSSCEFDEKVKSVTAKKEEGHYVLARLHKNKVNIVSLSNGYQNG